jgi:hypothetical protein
MAWSWRASPSGRLRRKLLIRDGKAQPGGGVRWAGAAAPPGLVLMRIQRTAQSQDPDDARCRVCGRNESLSFEHVPPQAAGNAGRAWMYGTHNWLGRDQESGTPTGRARIQQRGSGAYSLCRSCNERAGSQYVPDFLEWIDQGNRVLAGLVPPVVQLDQELEQAHVTVKFERVRPARFLKQVVTMLLAISPGGFSAQHLALVEYAQDPEWTGLPSEYQFYLSLYPGPIARFVGGAARLYEHPAAGWARDYVVELAYPPFAYVLSHNETIPAVETGCISNLADLTIRQRADYELPLLVGFGHTAFPLDYRTKAKLDADRAENRREGE